MNRPALVLFLLLQFASIARAESAKADEAKIDFGRQIQPILSENCYFCHGPDSNTREADLRLDVRDAAMAALIPGKSDESELFRRISSDDVDEKMPPPDSHRKLTAAQIELIGKWIDQGAEWSQHWSFAPLEAPELPDVTAEAAELKAPPDSRYGDWQKSPIDRLVLARLAKEKIIQNPSPRANKETLIRRASLDITGLPPTLEEIDAFVADDSPEAYERVVDRLLASPAYGERMAWPWLDAARYADTNGYQGDAERTMWPWRDWVIESFNKNMPYDEFTVQQIAGDLLPNATFEQKMASGFLRNHMINAEGGRIPEENRVDYAFDMAETTGTIWLGLTMNCCRCHDHKFDPITNKNYYELFAFFNQSAITGGVGLFNPQFEPFLTVPSPEQETQIAALETETATAKEKLKARGDELAPGQPEWEPKKRDELAEKGNWTALVPASLAGEHQTLTKLDDHSILVSGEIPANDVYTLTAAGPEAPLKALRLKALKHESLTSDASTRSDSGIFFLSEFEVRVRRAGSSEEEKVTVEKSRGSYDPDRFPVRATLDGDPKTGWSNARLFGPDPEPEAIFEFDPPLSLGSDDTLTIVLRHEGPTPTELLGRFALWYTADEKPEFPFVFEPLKSALNEAAEKRTQPQKDAIAKAFNETDESFRNLSKELADVEKRLKQAKDAVPKVMVMEDKERKTFILEKGIYDKPKDEVTPDVPDSLPPMTEGAPKNRLGLAQWLVANENPLMARVTVNRVWQQFFGMGLVKTVEDFGVQGEVPPQRNLLNWLAADFRDNGWDMKRLVKQIVTSETYCQESKATPEALDADPENRLLARAPRYRMPSWMIRDAALAASGLLVNTVGGSPVRGYQPPGIWEEATFGVKKYVQDHGDALYRRSLYTFWRRIVAPTMFFDTASRQTCTVKDSRTNTPLHALVTLNDVTFIEAARALAERAMKAESDNAARVNHAFRRATGRSAKPQEVEVLLSRLDRMKADFAADPNSAEKLLANGESKRDPMLDVAEHAAWTGVCSLILNLDETLSRQ